MAYPYSSLTKNLKLWRYVALIITTCARENYVFDEGL
jgi:hypothetical protein